MFEAGSGSGASEALLPENARYITYERIVEMPNKLKKYGLIASLSLLCLIFVIFAAVSASKDESGDPAITANTSIRFVEDPVAGQNSGNDLSAPGTSAVSSGLPSTAPTAATPDIGQSTGSDSEPETSPVYDGNGTPSVYAPELEPIVKPGLASPKNPWFVKTTAAATTAVTTTKAVTTKATTTKATTTKATTTEPVVEIPETAGGNNNGGGTTVDREDGQSIVDYFLEIAYNEIGTKETKYNCVKYNTWYYGTQVRGKTVTAYAWCSVFIAWCANQAGIPTSVIPKVSGVGSLYNFFKNNGSFTYRKSASPKPGDIIFFGSSRPYHVGIVYSVSSTEIKTIEGNASDQVKFNTYKRTDSDILGYGSPNYFG